MWMDECRVPQRFCTYIIILSISVDYWHISVLLASCLHAWYVITHENGCNRQHIRRLFLYLLIVHKKKIVY